MTNRYPETFLETGKRCLLAIMGRRFLVEIQKTSATQVEVCFAHPAGLEIGMQVFLEFQGVAGFVCFEAEIEQLPKEPGDYLILRCNPEFDRSARRNTWRVPGDFTTILKRHTHPRRHTLPIINLSQGGMLVRTDFLIELGENIDLDFTPPNGEREMLTGQVVHVSEQSQGRAPGYLIGLKFLALDPVSARNVNGYIWRRIHDLYPGIKGIPTPPESPQ